tara:strand:+ start:83 stop:400 length:318 start_codon:yes stop_codon:yes gene_type:complete
MNYRTFIHKDCDKEVFGPLYSRYPHNRKVGTDKHDFFSSTLQELSGVEGYERDSLIDSEMTPAEMYAYIYTRIGTEGYLGATETTEAQAGLMQDYENSIKPVEAI